MIHHPAQPLPGTRWRSSSMQNCWPSCTLQVTRMPWWMSPRSRPRGGMRCWGPTRPWRRLWPSSVISPPPPSASQYLHLLTPPGWEAVGAGTFIGIKLITYSTWRLQIKKHCYLRSFSPPPPHSILSPCLSPGLLHPVPLPPGGCLRASARLPEGPHHHQTAQDPWGPSITVLTALRLLAALTGPLLASPGKYSLQMFWENSLIL